MVPAVYIFILFLALLPSRLPAELQEKSLVILANINVPESIELAEYYAEKRNLPVENVCRLDLPVTEDISRPQYESRLRDPLLRFLREGEYIRQEEGAHRLPVRTRIQQALDYWRGKPLGDRPLHPKSELETIETSVHFLVPMYGVPLRIADLKTKVGARASTHEKNIRRKAIAAVDSELALCLMGSYPKEGSFRNPVYNAVTWAETGAAGARVMICSRLDAPTPDIVRRMIDDSLQAERYGIQGRGVIDARGIKSGGYFSGEVWLRSAYNRLREAAYDTTMDAEEEIFPAAFPLEDTAIYFGWYTEHAGGAMAREDFRFAPGAVAYHLHSGAAQTLRSEDRHWAGPLLAHGAAATMGAVHEPYLRLTVDLDIFAHRLCSGYSFGESAYMAMPALSWQMAIIGDPLYRPFRYTLDEQIVHMEADTWPRLEWGYARKVVQLVQEGYFNLALDYARNKIKETDSLVLRELLGDLYLKNNLLTDAESQYEYVLAHAESAATSIRVGQRWCAALRLSGKLDRAEQVTGDLQQRWPDSPMLDWLNRRSFIP